MTEHFRVVVIAVLVLFMALGMYHGCARYMQVLQVMRLYYDIRYVHVKAVYSIRYAYPMNKIYAQVLRLSAHTLCTSFATLRICTYACVTLYHLLPPC